MSSDSNSDAPWAFLCTRKSRAVRGARIAPRLSAVYSWRRRGYEFRRYLSPNLFVLQVLDAPLSSPTGSLLQAHSKLLSALGGHHQTCSIPAAQLTSTSYIADFAPGAQSTLVPITGKICLALDRCRSFGCQAYARSSRRLGTHMTWRATWSITWNVTLSSKSWKYTAYRNAARKRPGHGHSQRAQKLVK